MNLRAKVVYRNRRMEPVYESDFALKDYTDTLGLDLKRLVSDVEDLVYLANGNRPKDEWNEAEIIAFNKIRCKLLDKSGEISRLPECLYDANERDKPDTFWKKVFKAEGG